MTATRSILLVIVSLAPVLGWSGSSYRAGVAERSIRPARPTYNWRGAKSRALLTVIWYPVESTAEVEQQWIGLPDSAFATAGRTAPNAAIARRPARLPLVLLSHGNGSSALMLAWLGTRLAEAGFIAAAVNHPGNNAIEPYTPQGFTFWWERATDTSEVLTALSQDPQFGSRIDPSRIGAAGFSLGGFTAIELAGGRGTFARHEQFCTSERADELCREQLEFPDLSDRVAAMRETPEFQAAMRESTRSHRDARIRAVFAIAPALGPAFDAADLRKIRIPVAMVSGDTDPVVPVESSARFFAEHIPGASLTLYAGVGHYTFLATCTESGQRARPELCTDAAGIDRNAIHARAAAEAVAFFRKYLRASAR